MRGKKSVINTAMALLQELVYVISGLILPRLILTAFGSQYNGLTTSITQFLGCAVLLRSGIGGATRAAVYKPLANKDKDEINAIMAATDRFMKKIGLILGASIIVFAVIYPFFVIDEFDWFFSFSLFLIIGASTFAESFFGITYLILLQADQKIWVSSLLKSICYAINLAVATILIFKGASIHIVKLGSAIVYVSYPIILNIYVKKKYQLNLKVEPDNKAIWQRWDAFWHQTSAFVMDSTDAMVLTVFSSMLEVSVYSIYNMVFRAIKQLVTSITHGLEAAFGNMIAKDEMKALEENFSLVEWLVYSVATVVYTCTALLILQFVSVYTDGVTDVNYIRPVFAYVLVFAHFFNCARLPYQLVIQAAGHYKQTRNGAIAEPIINLAISIACVIRFGLVGVAVGTLVATLYRTVRYSAYMNKNILRKNNYKTIFRIAVSMAEAAIIVFVVDLIKMPTPAGYFQWMVNAIICVLISGVVVFLGSLFFGRRDLKNFFKKWKNIVWH